MNDATRMLQAAEAGDTESAEKLFPLVYEQLRRIAANKMAGERVGDTLQPTALVHEAYLKLAGKDGEARSWKSQRHFIHCAAEAMRRILIDRARKRDALKRGGDQMRTTFQESQLETGVPDDEILAVDEALQKLELESPELAEIVKLRYFTGMTVGEIAAAQGCSASTIDRGWRIARSWLFVEIRGGD